jgi:hypothetical protein
MKRSEMVNIIAEALLQLYGGAEDEWEEVRQQTRFTRIKTAHKALEAAEEAGMVPPIPTSKDLKAQIDWTYTKCWEEE